MYVATDSTLLASSPYADFLLTQDLWREAGGISLLAPAAAAMPEGRRLVIWAEPFNREALIADAKRRTDENEGRIVHPRRSDDKLSSGWVHSTWKKS